MVICSKFLYRINSMEQVKGMWLSYVRRTREPPLLSSLRAMITYTSMYFMHSSSWLSSFSKRTFLLPTRRRTSWPMSTPLA